MSLQTGSRPRSAGLGLVGILRYLYLCISISRVSRGGPRAVLSELVSLPVRGVSPRQHLPPHLGRVPLRGIKGRY